MRAVRFYGVATLAKCVRVPCTRSLPCAAPTVCAMRGAASCPGTTYTSSQTGASLTRTHYSKLGMDGFTDAKYNNAADAFLEGLENLLDEIDHPEMSDLNCSSGVLNLDTATRGSYIINKQAPNVQLWLSSPISGPHHYDMIVISEADGSGAETVQWISDNDGHSLKDLLEKELSEIFAVEVRLP